MCVHATENLFNLRKRELLEILKDYEVECDGLTKRDLIQRIHDLREGGTRANPRADDVETMVPQQEVAKIAMDDWQNAKTDGFDCRFGRRADDGVDFDIIGPDGTVQHTVGFRHLWPPSCTCADARRWGSQRRCKRVCMILVKCSLPYAAVASSNWEPSEAEVKGILQHMLGRWTPIPLS